MAQLDEPLVLAVDTSTLTLSAALTRGPACLAQTSVSLPRGHSRALLGTLHGLAQQADVELGDVDLFAVGLGPGSFTGLRIGLALLKGLALGYGRPLLGASSLRATAWQVAADHALVCPVVDARKAEVYAAVYRCSATDDTIALAALTDELVLPPRELAEQVLFCAPGAEAMHFVGTGVREYRQTLRSALGQRATFADDAAAFPSAIGIAAEALALWRAGERPSLAALEPRYIRPSEAELGGGC